MRRIQTVKIALFLAFSALIYFAFDNFYAEMDAVKNHTVLYWTPMFGQENFSFGLGRIFEHCEYKNCYATADKNLMPIEEFSAIIFHDPDFFYQDEEPARRSNDQYYIYANMESPINSFTKNWENFFNLTMTYQRNSDIAWLYGRIIKTETDYTLPTKESLGNKTKKIAWLVSNCITQSKREVLGLAIAKDVEVDVIGKCGEIDRIHCATWRKKECYDYIEKNYKFYLSFENSLCDDYVTEKLYNILDRDLIPVVYGGADYSKVAPPGSYVNVRDFENVKQIVDYLRRIDENDDMYLKFFEWKKHYVVDKTNQRTLCDLCKKLNEPIVHKVIPSIKDWHSRKNCLDPEF